jgi:hypothetical protein
MLGGILVFTRAMMRRHGREEKRDTIALPGTLPNFCSFNSFDYVPRIMGRKDYR